MRIVFFRKKALEETVVKTKRSDLTSKLYWHHTFSRYFGLQFKIFCL